jgi:predicted nucleic acid-binding protein
VSFVLDASVVLAWMLPDEANPAADAVIGRLLEQRAQAPSLLGLEVANALLLAERRGRLARADHEALREAFGTLPIAFDGFGMDALHRSMALARTHRLTVYDAAYLELAIRRGFPLASFDAALREAAERESVALIPAG